MIEADEDGDEEKVITSPIVMHYQRIGQIDKYTATLKYITALGKMETKLRNELKS